MVPTGTIPLFPDIALSRETKKRSGGGGGGDAHYNKNNQKETGGIALLAKEEAAAAASTAAAAAEALSPGAHSVSVIPCLVALSLMESVIMETRLSCHI